MKVRKHREKNRGLLPAEFQAVLEAIKYVPADLRPAMLETIMVMAGHGFGPKEYWEDGYEVHPDDGYVRIFGTKVPDSGVRVRNVPLLWPIPDAPSICRAAFEDLLQVVAQHAKLPRGVGLRPYTLRHTYGVWLNKAKGADKDTIDGGTQDYYMGHESPSMRALYGHIAPPVDQYARDGAILRHHLAGVLKAAHGQRVVADAKVA